MKKWLKAAAVRAIKTVVQTAIAIIGISAVLGESASVLAGILSLLTGVAELPELKEN